MKSKPKVSHSSSNDKPSESHFDTRTALSQTNGSPKVDRVTLSKTDVRFWKERLFKRAGADWQVQIGFAGHQERFPLRTPNKDDAAAAARDIYISLHAVGWDETRKRFKPWQDKVVRIDSPSVGDFLRLVERHSSIKAITFTVYARKFRRLVAGVMDIAGDKNRFDYVGTGAEAWRKKVDAVKLSVVTASAINLWKKNYVARCAGNPARSKRAESTAQSILRSSKSLFSKRVLKSLEESEILIQLPTPPVFAAVDIGKNVRNRYRSSIDAQALIQDASKELPENRREQWKIFLLAFGVGLRRDEIDTLLWTQLNWSKCQINVETTAHGEAKTDSSIAPVDVDPALMKLFFELKTSTAGAFVVESPVTPRPGATWHHYRCNREFRGLIAWLRAKGVNAHNPIHTLRKEFGSLVCKQYGLFAASEALRHSDIRLTRDTYVDRKERIHLEIGKMLNTPEAP